MNNAERIIRIQEIEKMYPFTKDQQEIMKCARELIYTQMNLIQLRVCTVDESNDISALDKLCGLREKFITLTKGK